MFLYSTGNTELKAQNIIPGLEIKNKIIIYLNFNQVHVINFHRYSSNIFFKLSHFKFGALICNISFFVFELDQTNANLKPVSSPEFINKLYYIYYNTSN